MTKEITSSIVRIRNDRDQVIGAGFLVSDRHILTCAHVVARALGVSDTTADVPSGTVRVDFPLVAPGEMLNARVASWLPAQSNGEGDIAGLELIVPLPDGAEPATLVSSEDFWDHPWRAYGFPEGYKEHGWCGPRARCAAQ